MTSLSPTAQATAKIRRVFWMRQFRQWHWISATICLIGLLAFAITGVTLNHAAIIPAEPVKTTASATLTAEQMATLPDEAEGSTAPLPAPLARSLGEALHIHLAGRPAEWSPEEVYVALPRPGGDAYLTLDRISGEAVYEKVSRGPIALLNDLHKGRNTGLVWRLFLDLFAVGCVIFTLSGLGLLFFHAPSRKITWPLTVAGLVVPVLLVLIFIH